VDLFSAVSAQDMRSARIVTGAAMAAFIGVGMVPALRRRAGTIRLLLVTAYLLACGGFVAYTLLR
jgi:hypothetical protein